MPLFHYSNALPVLYQITREQYQCMFLKSLNSFTTLNSEESTLFKNVNGTEQFCENKSRMLVGAVTVENSMEVSQKTKNRSTI